MTKEEDMIRTGGMMPRKDLLEVLLVEFNTYSSAEGALRADGMNHSADRQRAVKEEIEAILKKFFVAGVDYTSIRADDESPYGLPYMYWAHKAIETEAQ